MSTITESYAVDQQADIFVEKFAGRISPVAAYVGALYGDQKLRLDQVARVLDVVTHAVEFSTFNNPFEHKRAALAAFDVVERYIKDADRYRDVSTQEASEYLVEFSRHAQKLVRLIADLTLTQIQS